MMKSWWSWLLVAAAVLILTVVGYDRMLTIVWVGHTDLEAEFVVTDAATGRPMNDAKVTVHSEIPRGDEMQAFSLVTDQNGVSRHVCGCTCGGKESGLGFTNTFSVN